MAMFIYLYLPTIRERINRLPFLYANILTSLYLSCCVNIYIYIYILNVHLVSSFVNIIIYIYFIITTNYIYYYLSYNNSIPV